VWPKAKPSNRILKHHPMGAATSSVQMLQNDQNMAKMMKMELDISSREREMKESEDLMSWEFCDLHINDLPNELLLVVFHFLNTESLFRAARVCTLWNRLVAHPSLWKEKTWSVAMKNAPEKRLCHSSCVHNGSMYIFGGDKPVETNSTQNIGVILKDVHKFDFDKKVWIECGSKNFPALTEFNVVPIPNNKALVFAGITTSNRRMKDLHLYDFEKGKAELLECTGDLPPKGSCHTCVYHNNCMYVFGGWDHPLSSNQLYEFDIEKRHWTLLEPQGEIPDARRSHKAIIHHNSMYVFGGWTTKPESDIHRYDFSTNTWFKIPVRGDVPVGRSRFAMATNKDSLYIYGGFDGKNYLGDLYEFNICTQTWTCLSKQLGVLSGQHTMECHNDTLWIFGGNDGQTAYDHFLGYSLARRTLDHC